MDKQRAPIGISPDVATESQPQALSHLDWVGMENMATPVCLKVGEAREILTPAQVDVGVSLDNPEARGIHMSRLFMAVQERLTREPVTLLALKRLLAELIPQQEGLSDSGRIRVRFEWPRLRQALVSGVQGWRQYPVWLEVRLDRDRWQSRMGFEIYYSSTCPCSAALAQSLAVADFSREFGERSSVTPQEVKRWLEQGPVATPHAQRSRANIEIEVANAELAPGLDELIDHLEKVLGTPVQSAVKRADEQEFARLNALHLMFCEDAARRLKVALDQEPRIVDYSITVEHQESLHPHNAVARVKKQK